MTTASFISEEGVTTDDEAALINRLQCQFGDININNFLLESPCIESSRNQSNTDHDIDDDESSLEEPTAEELIAWQEAQFRNGMIKLESKKIIDMSGEKTQKHSALQRLRSSKSVAERFIAREYENLQEAHSWCKLPSLPDLGEDTSFFFPSFVESDGTGLEIAGGVHPMIQNLALSDHEVLGTSWKRLYSSSHGDGLSFRYLSEKIRFYEGPTVFLLRGKPSSSRNLPSKDQKLDSVSLGFFTADSWIESSDYFGTDDSCFLFTLNYETNHVQVFRPKSRLNPPSLQSRKHMYFHPSFSSNSGRVAMQKNNGAVHGIGIGGTTSQPRLHISESLEECRALPFDGTFEDGDLLMGHGDSSLFYFDVEFMEVWGVGGIEWISHALTKQAQKRAVYTARLEQARKVDKRQLLEDIEKGLIWRNENTPGLFGHKTSVQERNL